MNDLRKEWIQKKEEERKRILQQEKEEELRKIQEMKEKLWNPYMKEIMKTNEFNIAWKESQQFFTWERILPYQSLTAIRIIGHSLQQLPSEFTLIMKNLKILILVSDDLVELPYDIGYLRQLEEIDITHNKVVEFPNSMTELENLKLLNASENMIKVLPYHFGRLQKLQSLCLEQNKLENLPESFGNLQCQSINLNQNCLTLLPTSIGNLQKIEKLSLNINNLSEFPTSLTALPSLTYLSACRNRLIVLPENIGQLKTLEHLYLDWNLLSELPLSFCSFERLIHLRLEHNRFLHPPPDIVALGIPKIMEWLHKFHETGLQRKRREIIEELQNFLKLNDNEENHKLMEGIYENTVIKQFSMRSLEFYAYVEDALHTRILPYFSSKGNIVLGYSKEEIDDAIWNYHDDYSMAAVREVISLRQCECKDSNGKAKVCTYDQTPYHCQRMGILLRKRMVKKEEYENDQAENMLQSKLQKAIYLLKKKMEAYYLSPEGVAAFQKLGMEKSKEYINDMKDIKEYKKKKEKENMRINELKKKLQNKEEKREKNVGGLREKVAKLKKELQTNNKQKTSVIKKKIEKIEKDISKIMEKDKKEKEMERELCRLEGRELEEKEETKNSKTSKTEEETESGSGEESGSDEDDTNSEEDEESGSSSSGKEDSTEEEENEKYQSYLNEGMPELEEPIDYIKGGRKKVEEFVGEKIIPLENLLPIYIEALKNAYQEERVIKVKNAIIKNHYQLRNVVKRWAGMNQRGIFQAWKTYTKAMVEIREKTKKRLEMHAKVEKHNKLVTEKTQKTEAKKWIKKIDELSEEIFFENRETGEKSLVPPRNWSVIQDSILPVIGRMK